eukprot:jgi/Bigna1/82531/fgenesh1_pg.93_\
MEHGPTSPDPRSRLEKDGYVVLPKLIQKGMVERARRLVNEKLGESPKVNEMVAEGTQDAVTDLWNKTCLPEKIKEMMGPHKEEGAPLRFAQVALIFPGHRCSKAPHGYSSGYKPEKNWEKDWHIDGCVQKGEIHAFTALVGVLLQDIEEPMSGELVVYPGGHENMARLHGRPDDVLAPITLLRIITLSLYIAKSSSTRNEFPTLILRYTFVQFGVLGYRSLLRGGEHSFAIARQEMDAESKREEKERKWRKPVHLVGKAGDVVILNFMTPHVVAPNVSGNIRYCVYFRLYTPLLPGREFWNKHRRVSLAIPFHDWMGMTSACPHLRQKGWPHRNRSERQNGIEGAETVNQTKSSAFNHGACFCSNSKFTSKVLCTFTGAKAGHCSCMEKVRVRGTELDDSEAKSKPPSMSGILKSMGQALGFR